MPRPKIPAIALVLIAASSVAAIVAGVFSAPVTDVSSKGEVLVGEQEQVRLTGPDGKTVETLGRIDTGASSTSIDTEIAEELGLDLTNAKTITVQSALGEEERPVVEIALQVAGRAFPASVTVSDRSDVSNKVLLGRDELAGFQVKIGQEQLTSPGTPQAPSALATLFAARSSALTPASLLALMPLAAVAIVLVRNVIGIATLGTFSPVLLTFGFLQVGLLPALLLSGFMFAVGLAAEPTLRRSRLPRVGRIAVLIALVAILLLAVETITGLIDAADSWGSAFPLVVTALIIERLYEEWDLEGARGALTAAGLTFAVALAVLPLLAAPPIRWLAETVPLSLGIACLVWAWIAATYRGLRISELLRFGPLRSEEATT